MRGCSLGSHYYMETLFVLLTLCEGNHRWIPLQSAIVSLLFVWTFYQPTVEFLVIWDILMFIWRLCNNISNDGYDTHICISKIHSNDSIGRVKTSEIRYIFITCWNSWNNSDYKVHGVNMGPAWVLSAPDGPHVGPMNFAIKQTF